MAVKAEHDTSWVDLELEDGWSPIATTPDDPHGPTEIESHCLVIQGTSMGPVFHREIAGGFKHPPELFLMSV